MVVKSDNSVSIQYQCNLLGIHRSGLYYKPIGTNANDLAIMLEIDKLHLIDPTLGTRRMKAMLAQKGHHVGRSHIRTLMKKMRLNEMV